MSNFNSSLLGSTVLYLLAKICSLFFGKVQCQWFYFRLLILLPGQSNSHTFAFVRDLGVLIRQSLNQSARKILIDGCRKPNQSKNVCHQMKSVFVELQM